MNFAIPWILWALLAVPLVAAMFLFRHRVRVMVVPALAAWVAIVEPESSSRLRNLLRRLLTLLLETAVVGLLVVGAADPILHAKGSQSAVVVLDASATMRLTTAAGQTRGQMARALAEQVLDGLPADCRVRLVIASDVPRTPPEMGDTPAAVRRALQQVAPEQVDSDLPEALRLASSLIASSGEAELCVISDFSGAEPGMLQQGYKGRARLRLISVGEDQPNAGIQHAWCEPAAGGKLTVRATIRQLAMGGQKIGLSVWTGSTQLATTTCALSAPSQEVVLQIPAPASPEMLELRLDAQDALDLDNRFFLQSAGVGRRILLVTDGNLPLQAALSSAENTSVDVVRPEAFKGAGATRVVVFDRVRPREVHPEPGVSYLCIGTVDPFGWVEPFGSRSVSSPTSWAASHPSLQDVLPTIIPPQQAMTITAAQGVQLTSIVDCGDTPLLAEVRLGREGTDERNKAVYFLADPFSTSFPRTLAFPVLMLNTMDYLARGNDLNAPSFRTGEQIQISGPTGVIRLPRFVEAGLQPVQTPAGARMVAVNYVSNRPTQPLPARVVEVAEAGGTTPMVRWARNLRLTPGTLIMGGLALAVIEFILFHRGRLHLD
jgi:von Willebrand factor type A domain/Aerotolerance regulator N-terminal